jgi:hypothetical protein
MKEFHIKEKQKWTELFLIRNERFEGEEINNITLLRHISSLLTKFLFEQTSQDCPTFIEI